MIKFQTDIILKSIHYTGKTIGRNFSIKLKINGSSKTLNKQLKPNYVNECYDLIYTKSLEAPLKCDITINVVEKDSKPDKGTEILSANITHSTHCFLPVVVEIIEKDAVINNGNKCKLKFVFEINTIELGEKTLVEVDEKGWINGKLVKADGTEGSQISLPYGLKVEHYKTEQNKRASTQSLGKEYFKILEGKYKGKKARLLIPKNKKTRLKKSFVYRPACYVEFIYKEIIKNENGAFVVGNIRVNGLSWVVKAFSLYKDCLKEGEYYLEMPDEPHPGGGKYEDYSLFAKSWFRVKYPSKPKSAYYFHLGRGSDGCITVYVPNLNPANTWTSIYNLLVTCRVKGMPGIIGKVKVIDETVK